MLALLDAHFGQPADELPVVLETVESHRSVDVDIALEEVVALDPESRLVGIGGGDQRHHSSLSDLMAQAGWGRFRQGPVDRLNLATGPDSERATVAFGPEDSDLAAATDSLQHDSAALTRALLGGAGGEATAR